jgi:hypothetical protein
MLSATFLVLRINERDMILKMCIGLHEKYPLFLSDFNDNFLSDFEKNSNIKFHEKPSSGSRIVLMRAGVCKRTTSLDTTRPSTIFYRLLLN